MSTKTATKTAEVTETAGQRAARKWRAGSQAFMEEFEPVLEEVKKHAASMPHDTPEDSEAVLAYTIDKYKEFAEARRAAHAAHTSE